MHRGAPVSSPERATPEDELIRVVRGRRADVARDNFNIFAGLTLVSGRRGSPRPSLPSIDRLSINPDFQREFGDAAASFPELELSEEQPRELLRHSLPPVMTADDRATLAHIRSRPSKYHASTALRYRWKFVAIWRTNPGETKR